jgi:hypothetical protein
VLAALVEQVGARRRRAPGRAVTRVDLDADGGALEEQLVAGRHLDLGRDDGRGGLGLRGLSERQSRGDDRQRQHALET